MRNCNVQDSMTRTCQDYEPAGCQRETVAMAYVPWQYFHTVYEPEKALEIGTIFPELDKPFLGVDQAFLAKRGMVHR